MCSLLKKGHTLSKGLIKEGIDQEACGYKGYNFAQGFVKKGRHSTVLNKGAIYEQSFIQNGQNYAVSKFFLVLSTENQMFSREFLGFKAV